MRDCSCVRTFPRNTTDRVGGSILRAGAQNPRLVVIDAVGNLVAAAVVGCASCGGTGDVDVHAPTMRPVAAACEVCS